MNVECPGKNTRVSWGVFKAAAQKSRPLDTNFKNTPLIFITLTVVTLFTNNLISPLYISFEYQVCAFKRVHIIYLLIDVVMPLKR